MQKVAMLITAGFEDLAAKEPYTCLRQAGYAVEVLAPRAGVQVRGKRGEFALRSDKSMSEARVQDYDMLVLSIDASAASHSGLRALILGFSNANKPIAAVCHEHDPLGPYVDRFGTNLIASRGPADLPQFCGAILKALRPRTKL